MKFQLILIIILLFSCKNTSKEKIGDFFYPYQKEIYGGEYKCCYMGKGVLLEHNDSLSKIHFLEFKKDTILFNTKKIVVPSFVKDLYGTKENLFLLNTHPRTLGKKNQTTDFLTKYDKNFNQIIRKDLEISKYPNGNSFIIVTKRGKLFYITDGFEFGKRRKLIISELDSLFNSINKKVFQRQKKELKYNPVKSILIEDKGIVVISEISDVKKSKDVFRIEMFDLSLNRKWSEDFYANSIISLGYSKDKKKIFVISSKKGSQIHIWNYSGKELLKKFNTELDIKSAVINNESIFTLSNENGKHILTTMNFSGETINKKIVPKEIKTNTTILVSSNKQLFFVDIDNANNLLTVDYIKKE